MNILILIIQLIVGVYIALPPATPAAGKSIITVTAVCPGSNTINHSIVEDFLTKPVWDARREAANVENVSVSQITLLADSGDGNTCTSFNTIYQEALDEENSPGEKAYNVTYYKAGSFYFVVISIRQPANESYIATGVSYFDVYNQNLDLIKGYAF